MASEPTSSQAPTSAIERYRKRLSMLISERSTWLYHWQELNDYIFPRRFRYLQFDRNRGWKKNDKIINNKPTVAVRTLAAGMMAGITSPARPWFRLLAPVEVRDDQDVKGWLTAVEKITREELLKSNVYNVIHGLYVTLGTFGSPAMYIEETETEEEGFRAYLWPIGQYCLATSSKGKVDTIYRQFSMTVAQLVEEFGYEACSTTVRNMYDQGTYDTWIRIVHVIEPNRQRDAGKKNAKNKPFRSAWFEEEGNEQKFLRESGYDEFPVMAPRWDVTGEDVYGSCPGMEMLGDCKALQLLERRKAQAVDKVVNPPMRGPMSLKAQRISLLPGDITYVPDTVAGQKFEPAMEVRPEAVRTAEDSIYRHEYRIDKTCFVDLFLTMLASDQAPNGGKQPITATEVNERHEEKMLQLGPVLERIHNELLSPMLNRIIQILFRKGKLPPLPPALNEARIRVEYISIMAQAQKLIGTAGIERFSSFTGSLSAVKPEILDLIDYDKMIREYAEMLGIPADMLLKDKVVEQLRAQRAAQAQAQQQLSQMQQGAEAAKAAAGAQVAPDNLLGRLMGGVGGGIA